MESGSPQGQLKLVWLGMLEQKVGTQSLSHHMLELPQFSSLLTSLPASRGTRHLF